MKKRLELDRLPEDLVFIGGGYITHEFAHVAARAGSRVRILEMRPRPLAGFEAETVEVLVEATEALGVEYEFEVEVRGVEEAGNRRIVHFLEGGQGNEIETDLVVHGAGRIPQIEWLGLQEVGIAAQSSGVEVDEQLRSTSHPHIYAGGDVVAEGPPLTPVANHHGEVIAENLIGDGSATVDHTGVASVVFSHPPLASVGRTEREADQAGADYESKSGDMAEWANSRRAQVDHAAYKLVVDRRSGRLLGAHLIGPNAGEVINVFAMAIQTGTPVEELKTMFLAYPSAGYDIRHMV